jgi:hypothetical protein
MFVYEEKILKEYKIQVLEIVGWEGIWGVLITSVFLVTFFLIPGEDFGSAENPIQATLQLINSKEIMISVFVSSLVIAPFNYFGTSLTKYASAMHRCLVDASRMCIVWLVSMCCSWESFQSNQALGYTLILAGNLLYYGVIGLGSMDKPTEEEGFEKLKNKEEHIDKENEDEEGNNNINKRGKDLDKTMITKNSEFLAIVEDKKC